MAQPHHILAIAEDLFRSFEQFLQSSDDDLARRFALALGHVQYDFDKKCGSLHAELVGVQRIRMRLRYINLVETQEQPVCRAVLK